MMFNSRIKTSVLDKIILNSKDIETITEAIEKLIGNPVLASQVKSTPISLKLKGLIEVTNDLRGVNEKMESILSGKGLNLSEHKTTFYYDLEGASIRVGEVNTETETLKFLFTLDEKMEVKSKVLYDDTYKRKSNELLPNLIDLSRAMLLNALNFYQYTQLMTYLKQENAIYKKQTQIKQGKPKGMTKKEREREERRKRIRVSKPKVNYDYEEAQREGEKRGYERHTEEWEVSGHWRFYKKSGKRVFVKGYKKGNGEPKQVGKDFTI